MALSICLDLGCMLKCSNGLQWRLDCGMMDYNSKLVAFRLSIWHYKVAFDGFVVSMWHDNFTSKIVDEKAWEGIQFIGKGLKDQWSRWLERWRLKEGSDWMREEHMDCASSHPIRVWHMSQGEWREGRGGVSQQGRVDALNALHECL